MGVEPATSWSPVGLTNLDTPSLYRTFTKNWTGPFYHIMMKLKTARSVVNSAKPDQMLQNAASDLSLRSLSEYLG